MFKKKLSKVDRLTIVKRMRNAHNKHYTNAEIADLVGVSPGQITKDINELLQSGQLKG